jgi:hypothetical protein
MIDFVAICCILALLFIATHISARIHFKRMQRKCQLAERLDRAIEGTK